MGSHSTAKYSIQIFFFCSAKAIFGIIFLLSFLLISIRIIRRQKIIIRNKLKKRKPEPVIGY
jgi:hypothetical protein